MFTDDIGPKPLSRVKNIAMDPRSQLTFEALVAKFVHYFQSWPVANVVISFMSTSSVNQNTNFRSKLQMSCGSLLSSCKLGLTEQKLRHYILWFSLCWNWNDFCLIWKIHLLGLSHSSWQTQLSHQKDRQPSARKLCLLNIKKQHYDVNLQE